MADIHPKEIRRNYFSRVPEAREVLKDQALDIIRKFLRTLEAAENHGDYETASKGYQWLSEHFPADEDGTTFIDPGIDKVKVGQGTTGPQISIGIALGGIKKELPLPTVEVIEIAPKKAE